MGPAAFFATLLLLAVPGFAQEIDRPADERPGLPDFREPEERGPWLPPVPAPRDAGKELVAGLAVPVVGFHIEGSTVFSDEELQAAVAPWSGRTLRSEDLSDVLNALTGLYHERGFVNSGAVLPDQDLEEGFIRVRIVEGVLAGVRITGHRHFREGYLRDRIGRGLSVPLDVAVIEERLQILQQDPRIERVTARLLPAERLGEAVLHVEIREASRFDTALSFDNHEPPSIGALAGGIESRMANVVGWGDSLQGSFTGSEGLRRYRGAYEIAVSPWDTLLSFDVRHSDSRVVENPFDDLRVKSRFQAYRIAVRQPVHRTPTTRIEVGLAGDWRRTVTWLLGERFSFPGSGARNGESQAAVLRFSADWLRQGLDSALAARSQLSWGIDALGATRNGGDEPDGRFVSWLGQLQWAQRLGDRGIEALVRTDLQLASRPLLPMEQIAIGGYATVRGYRQNQRVQDQGVVGSVELRLPLWRDPERWGLVQLAPFFDAGHAWDHPDRAGDRSKTLLGIGLGLRWVLTRTFDARIDWGRHLTGAAGSGDAQDAGVHFQLRARFP